MAEQLQKLIDETKALRLEHRHRRRFVEAMACHVRETALREALAIVRGEPKMPMHYQPDEYR